MLACSSPSPPPALPDVTVDGGVKDGAGDSTLSDGSASGEAAQSDVITEGSATQDAEGEASSDGALDEGSLDGAAAYGSQSEAGDASFYYEAPPVALPPTSCTATGPGLSDCGSNVAGCCRSLAVKGNDFFRSFDSVTPDALTQSAPATVNDFQLDKYEITVGRFRQFVAAVVAGWLPTLGTGKHVHLNSGNGLVDSSLQGSFEGGWDSGWDTDIATSAATWNANLACDPNGATWTPTVGANEQLPITCATWFEAYAFCIWDNAFLPSEAEWNYAAAGGVDQRVYPWSSPPTSQTIDCSYANYYGASGGMDYCVAPGVGATNAVGSESPMGDGKWGQSDLAGNAWEWTLDYDAPYSAVCVDCAYLTGSMRSIRGGGFGDPASLQTASGRNASDPASRASNLGARCARVP